MAVDATVPVVAVGLVGGFAVARYSGRRELGGVVLGAAGAWCTRRWASTKGPAVAGGLLGRTIDTDGDRTLGTLIGGAGGALAGRAIERSGRPGYCR